MKIPNENIPLVSSIDPNDMDQTNINQPITMKELEMTLSNNSSKSPGPDQIPYIFLKNTGTLTKQHLLNIYNHIWHSRNIPTEWKRGNIIPIRKPGK